MNTEKLYLALNNIESNEKLIELFTYEETNSWIHVKYAIFRTVVKLNQINKKKEISKSFILTILKNLLQVYSNKKKSQLFFGSSRGLIFDENNKIVDIYTPVEFMDMNDTKFFMTLNSFYDTLKFKTYLKEKEVIFDNLIFNVYNTIKKRFNKKSINTDLSKVVEVLKNNQIEITEKELLNFHNDFVLKYEFYSKIIRKFKFATKAFLVSSHSKSFIIAALKKNNISVSEVQHGVIGKSHIGYDFKCDVNKLPIPNEIYVYNDFWKNEILSTNFTKRITIFNYYKYKHIFPSTNEIKKDYILFTGQGYFYKEISMFLEQGIGFLKNSKCILIYKPHPSEDKANSDIRKLCENNSDVLSYCELKYSTEYLIKYSKAHISIQSSCHFDAMEIIGKTHIMNIPSYMNVVTDYCDKYPEKFILIDQLNQLSLN